MKEKRTASEFIQHLTTKDVPNAAVEKKKFLAGIRKGISQIERGEFVPHEEVKRELGKWLSK